MRNRRPSREERALWREAMRGVRALRQGRPLPPPEAPPDAAPAAAPQPRPLARSRAAPPAAAPAPPPLAAGEAVGVDRRLAERLKRGQLPIEATLDLHGLTQAEAHASLDRFVRAAVARGARTVLVVTGKGRGEGVGVLRAAVPRWLNEAALREHLLAFAPARPEHGGAGALYILLRRRRTR
jgi:DNA-nicking Smr family endonuclease